MTDPGIIRAGLKRLEAMDPKEARENYLLTGLVAELLPENRREQFLVENGRSRVKYIPMEVYALAGGTDAPIKGKALEVLWKKFQASYNQNVATPQHLKPLDVSGYPDNDSIAAAEKRETVYRDKYADKQVDRLMQRYYVLNAAHPLEHGGLSSGGITSGLHYMFTRGHEADGYLNGVLVGLMADRERDDFSRGKASNVLYDLIRKNGGMDAITNEDRIQLWREFQISYNKNFAGTPDFVRLNEFGYADGRSQTAAWFVAQHYKDRQQERDKANATMEANGPSLVDRIGRTLADMGLVGGVPAHHSQVTPGGVSKPASTVPQAIKK